jgi:hypothetical protein
VSGTDASGADLDAFNGTVADGFDFLQVRVPGSACLIVCMTDVVAEAGAFAAYFAYF